MGQNHSAIKLLSLQNLFGAFIALASSSSYCDSRVSPLAAIFESLSLLLEQIAQDVSNFFYRQEHLQHSQSTS